MKIRANNQSIIALINNFDNHKRIKHIFIQYHYVRKLVKNKQINFIYFFIVDMLIDDLIKSLKRQLFEHFVNMLKLITSSVECV